MSLSAESSARRGRRGVVVLAGLLATLVGSTTAHTGWAEPSEPLSSSAADPAAVEWVETTLQSLELRQRVAQLVLPWIRGGEIPSRTAEFQRIREWIEEDQVGGLIVSRGAAADFAPMLNRLQALASVPLLIVSDLETGPGMRLTGGTNLPPAMAFGAAGSEELARSAGRITATEARAAGIHVTLGPVLDVNSNPFNPIINTRSFGEDPELVGRLASAWVEGARSGGLLTVGKHFPGHGATEVDSHMGLPSLGSTLEELERLELVPFRDAIANGLDGVLVGHIAVPEIDGFAAPPASLSPAVINGLLREQLGFTGLVFTDALNMGAITDNYSVPEASILALLAGADVLLQPPGEGEVIDSIVAAVEAGRIPRERVDDAVRRVLLAKASVGLHEGPGVRAAGGAAPRAHQSLEEEISAAAVTLVRDRDNLVPVATGATRILHVTHAPARRGFSGATLTRALSSAGRRVEHVRVNERTPATEYGRLLNSARSFDLVIVSASLVPREYRGVLALQDDFSRFVEALTEGGAQVIAVSFGSPYLLDSFPSVSSYLLAWSGTVSSQRAAARALLGEVAIGGRLPVSLPPHHSIGEGELRSETPR